MKNLLKLAEQFEKLSSFPTHLMTEDNILHLTASTIKDLKALPELMLLAKDSDNAVDEQVFKDLSKLFSQIRSRVDMLEKMAVTSQSDDFKAKRLEEGFSSEELDE